MAIQKIVMDFEHLLDTYSLDQCLLPVGGYCGIRDLVGRILQSDDPYDAVVDCMQEVETVHPEVNSEVNVNDWHYLAEGLPHDVNETLVEQTGYELRHVRSVEMDSRNFIIEVETEDATRF